VWVCACVCVMNSSRSFYELW